MMILRSSVGAQPAIPPARGNVDKELPAFTHKGEVLGQGQRRTGHPVGQKTGYWYLRGTS